MTVTTTPELTEVTLEIGGMTCASCVGRVQKALTRSDGVVTASVNLATESATVCFDPAVVGPDGLAAAVATAGYEGRLRHEPSTPRADEPDPADELDRRRDAEIRHLGRKWRVAPVVGLGAYRLWAQFRLGDGSVVTAPFVVHAHGVAR